MLSPDPLILLRVVQSSHPRFHFFLRVILDLINSRQCVKADISIFERTLNNPLVNPHQIDQVFMLFHILLQDSQVLLIIAQIAELIVIFLTDGSKHRFEVLDQPLSLAHLTQLRFLLLIRPDILVSSASGLLDINATVRNTELDEMVDLGQIESLRELLRA
jgi:hypothetical protein